MKKKTVKTNKVTEEVMGIPHAFNLSIQLAAAKVEAENTEVDGTIKEVTKILNNPIPAGAFFYVASGVSALNVAKAIVKPFIEKGYKAYWDGKNKEIRIMLEKSPHYRSFSLFSRSFPREEMLLSFSGEVVLGKKFFCIE